MSDGVTRGKSGPIGIGGALQSGRDQGKLGPWKLHLFFFLMRSRRVGF